MSGNLRLTSDHLHRMSEFLAAISDATDRHGIRVGVHMAAELGIDDDGTSIGFHWDAELNQYVIEDRVGD